MLCPKEVRILGILPQKTRPTRIAAGVLMLALLNLGCGKTDGVNSAMEQQMKELNATKMPVAKFAGHVTIDGKTPREAYPKRSLVVMLYDSKNATGGRGLLYQICRNDGDFAFNTYEKDDGVPTGSYVVLFAELNAPLMASKRSKGLHGPDALMNLYDDPDKNAQDPQFKVDVQPPGKTDYVFELKVAGKDAATPGPHAVTEIK